MPFIDWNGNGEIDPDDIAISIALDDDDYDNHPSKTRKPSNRGCATSMLTFIGIILFIILVIS